MLYEPHGYKVNQAYEVSLREGALGHWLVGRTREAVRRKCSINSYGAPQAGAPYWAVGVQKLIHHNLQATR